MLDCCRGFFLIATSLLFAFIVQQSDCQQPKQRYPTSYQAGYAQKYQPEYGGPQEDSQPPYNTRYNREQNNPQQNNRPPATTFNHQHNQQLNQQPNIRTGLNRPSASMADRQQHKCRIWVPAEVFDKYPLATRIQVDETNKLQLIEICCPGFGPVRWRANTLCRPLCENCHNGFCLEPGKCQCYEEFVRNDNGDCVFTCPLGCLNGRCYLDGSCQCDPGYKLDETRKFCRPICSLGCGNNPRHNCTEPEVCGCAHGYQLTDEGCQPTCQPECGAGGYCREDNICECQAGYNLKDKVCQADCYQKCDNGICYGRNRCICNPGFTYHERSTQCVPI